MKIILKEVRLSFPDLFTPVQYKGTGPFNYRASFLVQKDSKTIAVVNSAIEEIAKEKWKDKAAATLKSISSNPQKCCWYDGSLKDYDGFEGTMVLSATRPQDSGTPLLLDNDKKVLTVNNGRLYAGCFVNASVDLWVQDNAYGKAIRAQLLGVQFCKGGAHFGGGSMPSQDDFQAIEIPESSDFL